MRFELFENDGSRWLCKNIYARTQMIMQEHDEKKNKNNREAILLAEMRGVGMQKMADVLMMGMWLVSFKFKHSKDIKCL